MKFPCKTQELLSEILSHEHVRDQGRVGRGEVARCRMRSCVAGERLGHVVLTVVLARAVVDEAF